MVQQLTFNAKIVLEEKALDMHFFCDTTWRVNMYLCMYTCMCINSFTENKKS